MKIKTFCLILIAQFLISVWVVVPIHAANTFETETKSSEDVEQIIRNFSIKRVSSVSGTLGIQCFDVNENGEIALGFDSADTKIIAVFDSEGHYLYGYEFEALSSFALGWNQENLDIYLVRSNLSITVNSQGQIVSVVDISDTENNRHYWQYISTSQERKQGDYTYRIQNKKGVFNFFSFSYTQLVKISDQNEETILYDVNTQMVILDVIIWVCIAGGVALFVYGFRKQLRKNRRSNQAKEDSSLAKS